eukprot:5062942-Pyramimonas_sp.AAC.2
MKSPRNTTPTRNTTATHPPTLAVPNQARRGRDANPARRWILKLYSSRSQVDTTAEAAAASAAATWGTAIRPDTTWARAGTAEATR